MDHLAIMKKSWGLTEKIRAGEKTVESRWYKFKRAPWNKIKPGDNIYFKDSGNPISLKAEVTKVLQFDNLTASKTKELLEEYGTKDLGVGSMLPEIRNYVSGKNYCILVFFKNVKEVKPFDVSKKGFGAMSAWISIENIDKLRI